MSTNQGIRVTKSDKGERAHFNSIRLTDRRRHGEVLLSSIHDQSLPHYGGNIC